MMNVLELYSGIGGMHFALKDCGIQADVILAADINTVANQVYTSNFPSTDLLSKNILSLTSTFINDSKVDMILMSPPCQPYTRIGKQGDTADRRSDSLSHLIKILPDLNSRLQFILLENVRGFETSESRNNLLDALRPTFNVLEFMLNPIQFGIPNSRERYYLLARRKPFSFTCTGLVTDESIVCKTKDCFSIKDVLEFSDDSAIYDKYLVPENVVFKRIMIMDIVTKDSNRSCCFTKAYGRFIEGTGSVYCPYTESYVKEVVKKYSVASEEYEQKEFLESLRLRFFSPKEISRLMCFPEDFKFPERITDRQKYNLLGNSINVRVVSSLIKFLIKDG